MQRLLGLCSMLAMYFRADLPAERTPRISFTPKYNRFVFVFGRAKDIMELNGKAVEMSNM